MKYKTTKLSFALAAAVLCGAAGATESGSDTMNVSAAIVDECAVGNTADLAFGNLSLLSATGDQSTEASSSTGGTFDAICTSGTTSPKLKLTSLNSDTGAANFRLLGGTADYIEYTLSLGGTSITADSPASFTAFTADGTKKSLTLAGSIAADAKNGKPKQSYSDTITITSSYGV